MAADWPGGAPALVSDLARADPATASHALQLLSDHSDQGIARPAALAYEECEKAYLAQLRQAQAVGRAAQGRRPQLGQEAPLNQSTGRVRSGEGLHHVRAARTELGLDPPGDSDADSSVRYVPYGEEQAARPGRPGGAEVRRVPHSGPLTGLGRAAVRW
ncbi:hypothetical protein [Streptomyces sp. GC420]|uniref:hypothetical protein n=1 Tax=Streptomyces sp. GC420 TaxID=2697568 RepID=UPI001414CFC6|nr:hypothetical protein [Streptomyces sp. GC420]NBM20061.1 hypothetical protein [Streptomyces sp. GC420]